MPQVNVKLHLTQNELALVQSGKSNLLGLIKEANTNKIQKHVPLAVSNNTNDKTKGVLIGVGICAVVAIATAVTVALVKKTKERKELSTKPESVVACEYNQAMINYVDKAQEGTLSFKEIKRFADFFDALLEDYKTGDIKIKLSSDEINTLYGIIYKFTKELCEKSNALLDAKYTAINNNPKATSETKVEYIKDMLTIQKHIYQ